MSKSNPPKLPEYENPPVIEVVCGLSFAPLEHFKAIHVGLLWERMRKGFPNVEEQPPLATHIEQLSLPTTPTAAIELMDRPPLPRVWFLDEPGNGIIQVQRDAFLHNWRKLKADDQYPRFRTVIASFRRHFETFISFIEENDLGHVAPIQCELTYVNHIPEGAMWSRGKSLGTLFRDFQSQVSADRFLPAYEGVNWRNTYRLPEQAGRLHAAIQIGLVKMSGQPVVAFELKARGIGEKKSVDEIWPWFETAHEWIVRGFTDMTTEGAQKEMWRRTV